MSVLGTRPRAAALLGSLLAASASCAGAFELPTEEQMSIDDYITSLDRLPETPPQVVEGQRSADVREGDYSCSTQNLSETRQYDRIVAYSAGSEVLWPGAIVRGDSIASGSLTQIVLDRAPLSFSVSLENLAGAKSATMERPSLGAFRDALTDVLDAEITGATPANLYAELEQVHSEEQLSLALGASASWLGSTASIASSFHFDEEHVRSRYLVKYTQAYYTVDVDQPGLPSDFLADTVTLDDVRSRMQPGNPPAYVSSITYGRMVVFTFESEYSGTELGAALEFVYRGGVDVSGDVSVTYRDIVSKANITAYILGGSGAEAASAIDSYEALMDFIKAGGDYSRQSPGAPIAYKLSYLADNSPARLSLTEDYEIKECVRVGQKVKVSLRSITVDSDGGDGGDGLELYGNVVATSDVGQVVLLDKDKDHYVAIKEGESWPPAGGISDGVLDVEPRQGSEIRIRAQLMDFDGGWSPDDSIGDEEAVAAFETGWRRDVTLLLTGDGARVTLTFDLEPI